MADHDPKFCVLCRSGAHRVVEPPEADDLRDRITEALVEHALTSHGLHERPAYIDPHTERIVRENSASRADAVLAVVAPKLERLRKERDEANASWERVLRRAADAEQGLVDNERQRFEQGAATGEALQRAEQAEAERDRAILRVSEAGHDAIAAVIAERDALKATFDRVRALATPGHAEAWYDLVPAEDILAALDAT